MKKLFFICGTGRNGSLSIAQFLSAQPNMLCMHEGGDANAFSKHRVKQLFQLQKVFKWEDDFTRLRAHYEQAIATRPETYVGDVGMYMISYVPDLARTYPDAKFLCIRRSKEATVRSYLHRSLDLRRDASRYDLVRKIWDACYPRYDARTIEEALSMYWDEYYERAAALEKSMPGRFEMFETENLNASVGRNAILGYLEYPTEGRRDFTVHTNKESPFFTRWNKAIRFIRE